MSIGDIAENAILNKVFRNTDFTYSVWYVSLHTGNPTETGGTLEMTGGSYTRQTATFDAPSAGTTKNSGVITFVVASGTLTHVSIWNTLLASGSGTMLWYGTLANAKVAAAGDTLQFAAGSLVIQLD